VSFPDGEMGIISFGSCCSNGPTNELLSGQMRKACPSCGEGGTLRRPGLKKPRRIAAEKMPWPPEDS
jgi:hypothetical protein